MQVTEMLDQAPGVARGTEETATHINHRGRKTIPALFGVLGLGLLVRILHLWKISNTAMPKIHTVVQSDMLIYWNWAQQIRSGDFLKAYHSYYWYLQQIAPLETWYHWWGGKEIFRTAPLYPYWVAAMLALSGGSLIFVLFAQLLVGTLQPLVLFGLARRLFDERVGLVAAGLTALYGPFIFYEGVLLRDWLPPLLEPLALLALVRARDSGRGRAWLLAGAALGLALLAKETVLLFLPLVGCWLVWEHWPGWRRAVPAGVWLLSGLVLCTSPLLVRNALVGAPLFSFSNRAAQTFIEGNAADGAPIGWAPIPETMRQILERSDGKLVPMAWETLQTYHGDYGAFFQKQLLKLWGLMDAREAPGEVVSFNYGLEVSAVLRFTLRYGFVFSLGIAGLLMSLRTWRRQRLLYLYLLAVLGGLLFGAIVERYRLVLVPAILLYASVALIRLFETVRERHIAQALRGLGLILGVAIVQHVWVPSIPLDMYQPGGTHLWAARVYLSENRFEKALGELDRLAEEVKQYPGLAVLANDASLLEGDSRARWAQHLLGQGKRDEAWQQVTQAERAFASHLNLSVPCYNLGVLYLRLGEPAKAKMYFDRFLTLEPDGARANLVRRLLVSPQG
jgi:4-amino-4-deoxy-L-arabinose transferase-like glycosyltransferase